ncbi:Non-specific serine/threonine protein kinase protein, partial [Dioscorea alata]
MSPLSSLVISSSGEASLNDSSGRNIFSNAAISNDTKLVLNNDGSLVLNNWRSFDSPTDTILANQAIPSNGTSLTSSNGKYQFVNATNLVFNNNGTYWGTSNVGAIRNLSSDGKLIGDGGSLIASNFGSTRALRRLTLDPDGNLRVYSLHRSGGWRIVWEAVQERCTVKGTCGPNAICVPENYNEPSCVCPPGYRWTNVEQVACVIKTNFSGADSKFLRLDFVTFDNGPGTVDRSPQSFDDCQKKCLANSSCAGFSYRYNGERYCLQYSEQLAYGYWSPATKTVTYLRVAMSERDVSNFTGMTSLVDTVCPVNISLPEPAKESKTTARNLAIIITLFAAELLVAVMSFWAFLSKYSKYQDMARAFGLEFLPAGGPKRFSYAELKAATNDFSNLLGRGAFGQVFKGELPDHRVVAVKRLKNVDTGEAEFWAEVTIIARMHHLNLVRMWGFCAEREQRMLVYEYIPNGSLDKYIFQPRGMKMNNAIDTPERPLLDWNIRYRIAVGVARAIAYLHEECLEWVLHCDIKPENILLEDDFCPKVSDFGLSKLANKEDMVSMSNVRGTPGYMAPEWVMPGQHVTAKADVFSFGMVLLEIVSGERNNEFRQSTMVSEEWYYPKWAFEKVYLEKKVEDILDRRILDKYDDREHFALVDRMVKTAMWCLQGRPEMRPSMGKVAKMLEGSVEIMEPEKPTIFY